MQKWRSPIHLSTHKALSDQVRNEYQNIKILYKVSSAILLYEYIQNYELNM